MQSKSFPLLLFVLWALTGWQLSFGEAHNPLEESLTTCNGSFIETAAWQDTVFYCKTPTGDNGQGVFTMINIGASPNPYAYIITDTAGNILGLPSGNQVDFTTAPPGECWIYGLSYTGTLTASLGQNIFNATLSDSCFDLSNNFVVVLRDSVNGGTITSERRGLDSLKICLNGGSYRAYKFDSTGTGTGQFTYIVTNDSGTILGIPPGDYIDFRLAGPGICYVWGLNYTGNLTAALGANALTTNLSDDCFDLSDNFIVVVRDRVDGGTVQTEAGEDTVNICYNGGTPLVLAFDSMNAMGSNFTYVVTDNNGVILGVPPGDMVDFSGAGPGECWVWGLSYFQAFVGQPGDTITDPTLCIGCFDLSDNFVVVFRDSVDAGVVKSTVNGPDDLYVCYNDPTAPTAFKFDSLGHFGPNFQYVVTDAQGTILGLPPGDMVDFAGAGPGECWVWGLSYTGNLTAMVGQNATSISLSDGCFDLSDNFIRVFRDSVSGGRVTSAGGMDTLQVCYNGGTPTVFAFDSMMTSGPNFTYVVTDAQGTILGVPPADMVNFAGAGPGECWVWGLSYTGNLTAMV
ncbi:MAG: hypothetical protein MRZ79_11120, partial [Bacteroidia bacterium]|nr:hypothetical protein [Bacteroidia bacterium]